MWSHVCQRPAAVPSTHHCDQQASSETFLIKHGEMLLVKGERGTLADGSAGSGMAALVLRGSQGFYS